MATKEKILEQLHKEASILTKIPLKELNYGEEAIKTFSTESSGFLFDYSKQFISTKVISLLLELYDISDVPNAILELQSTSLSSDSLSTHTHYRNPQTIDDPSTNFNQFYNKTTKLIQKKNILHIIHIGMGGSLIGPQLLCDTLKSFSTTNLSIHFLSSLDFSLNESLFAQLPPEKTLVILNSKSGKTEETLTHFMLIKNWLMTHLSDNWSDQCIGVTAYPTHFQSLGLNADSILTLPHRISGRYSIWTEIGLSSALFLGLSNFQSFLEGGFTIDQHMHLPSNECLPATIALIQFWNNTILNNPTYGLFPYSKRLEKFPAYIQQLFMESNGKKSLSNLYNRTMNIIWGGEASEAEHSYFQILHEGTNDIHIEFLSILNAQDLPSSLSEKLLSSHLKQADMLAYSTEYSPTSGNKASVSLFMKELNPYFLGKLIAIYEYIAFIQSTLWNTSCFSQQSIDLGKELRQSSLKSIPIHPHIRNYLFNQ